MKKYLIAFLVIIISVCSVYALDYFGVVDLPIGSAKVTVQIFVQDAQTGEYKKSEIEVRAKPNSAYVYSPLNKEYYDLDLQRSVLQTQNTSDGAVLTVYYNCQTCEVTFSAGEDATLVYGEEKFTVRKGQTPTPPTYYKKGYEVSGYDKELLPVYQDTFFTANWAVANYTLTLNVLSGATVDGSDYDLSEFSQSCYQKSFTYFDDEFYLPVADYYGYIFMGWYDSPNGQGERYQKIESGSEGDLTLYSHFNVVTYEMKFVSPSSDYSFQSIIAPENGAVRTPVIPAKYQIPGSGLNWYSDSSFNNLYTFTVMPKDGITLYGKWEVDTGVGIWGDYNFQSANETLDSEEEFILYLDYVTYNYITENQSIVKDITFATKTEIERNMSSYIALTEYFGTFPVVYSLGDGKKSGVLSTIRVFVGDNTKQKEASESTQRNEYTPYTYPDYNYVGRDDYSNFYIDGIIYTQAVETSNQLVYAVEHGYRPICKEGSAAESMFGKAKTVLNGIIGKNFTDYEKALAIFEYLALNVQYDINAVNLTLNEDGNWGSCDAFYLEGVFNNKKAVCDGISKAFSLMCNIEGIPCVQVSGNNHAWCKVKINNRWTIVDPTHGNTLIEADKKGVLAHEHFMMSESVKASLGYTSELYSNIVADYSLNYFEIKTFVAQSGSIYNFVANGKEDIALILNNYRSFFNGSSILIDFCYTGKNFERDLKNAMFIVGYSGNIRSTTFNSPYGSIIRLLF